jgi:hypothetical protein
LAVVWKNGNIGFLEKPLTFHLHIIKRGVEFPETRRWQLHVTIRWETRAMKRMLILTAAAMILSGTAGCRFCECLFRGPACRQAAPVATCPSPCPTVSSCDPCATAPALVTPGPGM